MEFFTTWSGGGSSSRWLGAMLYEPDGRLLRRRRAEAELVTVGVNNRHFPCVPLRVTRQLERLDPAAGNLAIEGIDVVHHEVSGATDLAVPCMLGEEKREPVARELREDGQARLEPMLPINGEAKARLVEGSCALPVRHSQLGKNTLTRHGA